MYSMTGYGKGESGEGGLTLTAEVRSVNNRYLDISVKSPRILLPLEERIRGIVRKYITRGHVDVFIGLTDKRERPKAFLLDLPLARSYAEAAKSLEREAGLKNDLSVSFLLRLPDVVRTEENGEEDALEPVLTEALTAALEAHRTMRRAEGERLHAELSARMDTIALLRDGIAARAPFVAEEYRKKLTERMQELLSGKADEARILTEAAVFTDKCNIDEELTRLSSHIAEFRKIEGLAEVGRKLDFLLQEFNRECNTICSKSNDTEVTRLALAMKNEIEKVREQIQNLE